jgi:CsoR family transcriptional regulator, copper-sensing transcriptional repressor
MDIDKHPDHRRELIRINRIKGQLEGVQRMIVDKRYCPDILVQTKAIVSAVRSLEASLLQRHLEHCVAHAYDSKDEEQRERKLQELIEIFTKRLTK